VAYLAVEEGTVPPVANSAHRILARVGTVTEVSSSLEAEEVPRVYQWRVEL